MAEVKESNARVSARAAADHICVSPVTFSKYLNEGIIERQPRHIGYDLRECRRARYQYLENLAAGRSGADGGDLLSKQRARLAEAQTKAQELKTGVMTGEYVRLATFIKVAEQHFIMFREIGLNTGGKISDTIAEITGGDRNVIFNIIDNEIREMLERIATADIVSEASDTKQGREAAAALLAGEKISNGRA